MKLNEVIRTFRKEQNLTQEQIANYLGVSAPAVNKWENGNSYPDITLLAPLARILKTDIDTLLSFREGLTDQEIDQKIKEISMEITSEGYEAAFESVTALIKEYPNCDKLVLFMAQILNAYLPGQEIENKEKYKKQIISWLEMVAFSPEKELANMATMSLSQSYMSEGKFEQAQKLLDRVPKMGFDKRPMQANLYSSQGKQEEALKVHEEMMYQYANGVVGSLMQMTELACKQKDYDKALQYAKLARTIAEELELGQYLAASAEFMVAARRQEKEESLRLLEEMVTGIGEMYKISKSELYQHMKFKADDGFTEMKEMIKRSLESDRELDFIRQEPEYKKIIECL